jgi:hypothetical protein
LGDAGSGVGVGADCDVCWGCKSLFLSPGATTSASFWASAISGVGTASDVGVGMPEGVVEGADSAAGVILRRFDALSPSTASSSLSRLSSRGLSVGGEGSVVGVTEWAGAARASLVAVVVASNGAITAGEDGEGEEVDEDGGGGRTAGRGFVVSFLTAAAPHVHLSRKYRNKIDVSLNPIRAVSKHVPAPTYLKGFVPIVRVLFVPSGGQQDLGSTTSNISTRTKNEEHTVVQLGLCFLKCMKSVRSLGLRALQQFSKALLLARGPYVVGLNHGKLLLHGSDGGRPRLLKERLCRLEHSESGDRRCSRETLLKLLLCLRLHLRLR